LKDVSSIVAEIIGVLLAARTGWSVFKA